MNDNKILDRIELELTAFGRNNKKPKTIHLGNKEIIAFRNTKYAAMSFDHNGNGLNFLNIPIIEECKESYFKIRGYHEM